MDSIEVWGASYLIEDEERERSTRISRLNSFVKCWSSKGYTHSACWRLEVRPALKRFALSQEPSLTRKIYPFESVLPTTHPRLIGHLASWSRKTPHIPTTRCGAHLHPQANRRQTHESNRRETRLLWHSTHPVEPDGPRTRYRRRAGLDRSRDAYICRSLKRTHGSDGAELRPTSLVAYPQRYCHQQHRRHTDWVERAQPGVCDFGSLRFSRHRYPQFRGRLAWSGR